MEEDIERVELQSVEVHHVPFNEDVDHEDLHFPISQSQVNDLLGQVLTQLEATNLSEKSERANKAIFKQMVWHWFDEVMDNSYTSTNGCIAPIKIKECSCKTDANSKSVCMKCAVPRGVKLVDPNNVSTELRK